MLKACAAAHRGIALRCFASIAAAYLQLSNNASPTNIPCTFRTIYLTLLHCDAHIALTRLTHSTTCRKCCVVSQHFPIQSPPPSSQTLPTPPRSTSFSNVILTHRVILSTIPTQSSNSPKQPSNTAQNLLAASLANFCDLFGPRKTDWDTWGTCVGWIRMWVRGWG